MCVTACGGRAGGHPTESPLIPQVSGTIETPGVAAAVRIVRDRWGIPHIYATSQNDLFVAQGFVQAEDRLFQMDLWRRSSQGRLSEVLGANFIERDAMTRRMQYRGDLDGEWASYGPDARAIAESFTRGVNAWVALARARPPETFVLAGWQPDFWSANDLLNRTDAFLASRGAIESIERQGLSDVVSEAIRRVGAPPFLILLATPVPARPHGTDTGRRVPADDELVSPGAFVPVSAGGAVLRGGLVSVAESAARFAEPSLRYLVHLNAPGWNVIGATAPWRPGVAVGHNDHLAWGAWPVALDNQQVFERPRDPAATRVFTDAIVVKGRQEPFAFETEVTPYGVVVAVDGARGRVFTVQWAGFEAGAAPELASLAIDTAETAADFRRAVAGWVMPPNGFVYADVDGRTGEAGRAREAAPDGTRPDGRSGLATRAIFAHPLGITEATRRRFTVGPVQRPGPSGAAKATWGVGDQPFQAVLDPQSWDHSGAVNAPGQSEWPDSPHFSDLAKLWSAGELVPLAFSDAAVRAITETTLTLVPVQRKDFVTSRTPASSQGPHH